MIERDREDGMLSEFSEDRDYGDLDAALANLPIAAPSLTGAHGRPKTHRHIWTGNVLVRDDMDDFETEYRCIRCGILKDEARSRRGRSASRHGKDGERDIARDTGGKRVGQYGGPVDVLAPIPARFAIQSKRVTAPSAARDGTARRATFPEWIWDELRKLPVTGGDVPALIVSDKPGPGRQRRALVVVDYRDYVDLYGEPK